MPIFKSIFRSQPIPLLPLHDFVFRDFYRFGDRAALVDGPSGAEYTFNDVQRLSKNLAYALANRGFNKGDIVALYAPNSCQYGICWFGVSMLGGILTLANPLYTVDELSFQLQDTGAIYLFTVGTFLEKARAACEKVGCVREIITFDDAPGTTPFSSLTTESGRLPIIEINPKEDTVCIPYSSGTTGLPKGVMLTHFNIVANLVQMMAVDPVRYGPEIEGRPVIAVLPFFHIYGLTVLLNHHLQLGAKLVIMPKFDLIQFLELMSKYKIVDAYLVPPILVALAKHPAVDNYQLPSLKFIMSGAAPLGPELQSTVAKRLGCLVAQGYGMTELSPVSHLSPIIKAGSVGQLLANCEAKIAHPQTGEELDYGQDGEVCIRGPNVMKGYWKRPEATSAMIDSDGFLHTGDIGHVDQDECYFIVDRVKELIKVKGFQVAPAELEAHLLEHPSIADAAVIARPDEEAGELPRAYIVLKAESKGTTTEDHISSFLKSRVAPHKQLKGGVVFTDTIPKSASGKILRRMLRDRDQGK